jgi:uncharacterized protein HemY
MHRAAALTFAARVQLGERSNITRFVDLAEQGLTAGGNLVYSLGIVVESLVTLGDLNRAELFAQKAHDHAAGRLREMLTLTALGDVRSRLGPAHWQSAQRHYDQAIALAEAMQSGSVLAIALIGAGELAEARGDRMTRQSHGRRALRICRDLEMGHYLPRAERLVVEEAAAAVSA